MYVTDKYNEQLRGYKNQPTSRNFVLLAKLPTASKLCLGISVMC